MLSQELIAAKSRQLHLLTDEAIKQALEGAEQEKPMHKIELELLQALLRLGHAAVEMVIELQGDGDEGEQQSTEGKTLHRSQTPRRRLYVSIFGQLSIERYVYAQREGQRIEFAAVDARLALPESKFSYLLQEWNQYLAMDAPFAQAGATIEKILGLKQHVDSIERINGKMAQQVESFHDRQKPPPAAEEGQILVQTADGKGVPIRRPADAAPIQDHQRRSGPKPDRKKIATLGAVYSVDPVVRTPEAVVESLFCDPQQKGDQRKPKPKRPRPCHKRMRAMLNHMDAEGYQVDGRPAIFGWISEEVQQRRRDADQPLVSIMDGEQSLWAMKDAFQKNVSLTEVLDLLHVTPRLWEAAALFHDRNSEVAKQFVRSRVLRILRGEVRAVIREFRRMATQKLSGKKRRELEKICNYFANNAARMRYHEYLACGYPIASGVIEGACRNVVKDRLERTGMNWTVPGAQAMLDLRCVYLCGDWDAYVEFRVERETEQLYPYRQSLESLDWAVAA